MLPARSHACPTQYSRQLGGLIASGFISEPDSCRHIARRACLDVQSLRKQPQCRNSPTSTPTAFQPHAKASGAISDARTISLCWRGVCTWQKTKCLFMPREHIAYLTCIRLCFAKRKLSEDSPAVETEYLFSLLESRSRCLPE